MGECRSRSGDTHVDDRICIWADSQWANLFYPKEGTWKALPINERYAEIPRISRRSLLSPFDMFGISAIANLRYRKWRRGSAKRGRIEQQTSGVYLCTNIKALWYRGRARVATTESQHWVGNLAIRNILRRRPLSLKEIYGVCREGQIWWIG